ncbi:hypothetical protein [Shewanella sp. NIFS-20-20]|uniref:hypothetical protein n=1 Tax=Shewanella sp. NIFS-20-20 TaxID=2853806 RepID=UPI001C47CBF6|nr:hypothetical protein [Shewanella sp. NIFS-20-20]MBV7314723.1 hypothetical protein [Shewanella sp. NIFS-20-20]
MSTRAPMNHQGENKSPKTNYEQMADDFVAMFTAIAKQRPEQTAEILSQDLDEGNSPKPLP